jgi:hypothetical protein
VIVAPDLEKISSEGGLDSTLSSILGTGTLNCLVRSVVVDRDRDPNTDPDPDLAFQGKPGSGYRSRVLMAKN